MAAEIIDKVFQQTLSPDTPASPSGSDRKSRRFKLLSSRSGSKEESGIEREGPISPKHVPVVEQEATSIFKERFVPPELSIWDYFIAKVKKNKSIKKFKNLLKHGHFTVYSFSFLSVFSLSNLALHWDNVSYSGL